MEKSYELVEERGIFLSTPTSNKTPLNINCKFQRIEEHFWLSGHFLYPCWFVICGWHCLVFIWKLRPKPLQFFTKNRINTYIHLHFSTIYKQTHTYRLIYISFIHTYIYITIYLFIYFRSIFIWLLNFKDLQQWKNLWSLHEYRHTFKHSALSSCQMEKEREGDGMVFIFQDTHDWMDHWIFVRSDHS